MADLDTVLSIVPNRPRRGRIPVDRPLTVRQLLTRHVELQDRPTAEQLTVLAALNPCPPERAALEALAENTDVRAADQRTLLDLIEDHPALRETLTWPALLELLPPIRPRHYSPFGCDAPDADYLYADELHAAERAGAVSLCPAFSSTPVDGRRFVQDRITAEADEVWELLNAGARVRVCGDGARMAPGVRDAFQTIYLRKTRGADRNDAQHWLQGLMDQNRYVEDVHNG